MTRSDPATDVFVAINVQVDFCPGGAAGDAVVPACNTIAPAFGHLVATQDWHTPGRLSFADSHPNRAPFETIQLAYGPRINGDQWGLGIKGINGVRLD